MTSFVANERLESSCYETTLCVGSPVFSFHTEPHRSALNKERWPITRNINQWFINWNRSSRFCALLFIPVRPRTNECWTRLCEKRTQKRRSNSLVECVSLGDRRVAQFAYEDDLCRCAPTDSIERHDSAIFVVEPSLLCKWALRWPSGPWPVLLLVGCVPFSGLFGALFWWCANEHCGDLQARDPSSYWSAVFLFWGYLAPFSGGMQMRPRAPRKSPFSGTWSWRRAGRTPPFLPSFCVFFRVFLRSFRVWRMKPQRRCAKWPHHCDRVSGMAAKGQNNSNRFDTRTHPCEKVPIWSINN